MARTGSDQRYAIKFGNCSPTGLPQRDEDKKAIEIARRIWDAAHPVGDTPASVTCEREEFLAELPLTLRFSPRLKHAPSGTSSGAIAAIVNADNEISAVQRIYLAPVPGRPWSPSSVKSSRPYAQRCFCLSPPGYELST